VGERAETFDTFLRERLDPLFSRPPHEFYPQAIALIEAAMPEMPTAADRSEAYHWLGMMHQVSAAEALRADDVAGARERFALMEEFLAKSIDEVPDNLSSRRLLARYYLTFGEDSAAALELLDIPSEWLDAVSASNPALEHEWLGLRGVAHALGDNPNAAIAALDAAYHERFVGVLDPSEVDVSPIKFLLGRGIRLEAQSAAALRDRLLEFGVGPETPVVNTLERIAAG